MPTSRPEALLAEYTEVSNNFRMLTEIRFKLLAFLPLAAGVGATVLLHSSAANFTLAFSLFGLVATIGLVTYNTRNDQLYDTLVARAAAIERHLGIPDGAFANRPRPWLRLARGRWQVDHRVAVATIYKASIALWLFLALHAAIEMAQHALTQWISLAWADFIAAVAAVALTILGSWLVERARQRTADSLRRTAAAAVNLAEKLERAELADNEAFLLLCEELAGTKSEVVQTRTRFVSQLQSEAIAHYVAEGSAKWTAAWTVALITDLAPEWLYDSAARRRRQI